MPVIWLIVAVFFVLALDFFRKPAYEKMKMPIQGGPIMFDFKVDVIKACLTTTFTLFTDSWYAKRSYTPHKSR